LGALSNGRGCYAQPDVGLVVEVKLACLAHLALSFSCEAEVSVCTFGVNVVAEGLIRSHKSYWHTGSFANILSFFFY